MCRMKVRTGASLLLLLLTSLTGLCKLEKKYVMRGEMVAMLCNKIKDSNGLNSTWINHSDLQQDLSQDPEVLLYYEYLVIFRASQRHQGNYSCTVGDTDQMWFSLIVQDEVDPEDAYSENCSEQESCKIECQSDDNVPEILENSVIWITGTSNRGDCTEDKCYYPSVSRSDEGLYTCMRVYRYQGLSYNRSFTMNLIVERQEPLPSFSKIISPKDQEVFYLDLGQKAVITCEADAEVFWIIGEEFVELNDSFRVHSNNSSIDGRSYTRLIFKHVSEEDLLKNYTCKMETESKRCCVTITLARKVGRSLVPLVLSVVVVIVLLVVAVAIYMKFKIEIRLHVRDTLGCHRQHSDSKLYDAFLLSYKCEEDPGLKENDRKWLQNILEEKFGYNICVFERDVLPGEAVAQAVLDYIEQSRAVVLIPTSVDPGLGSSLPSTIHEALVERKANLIFLKTQTKEEGSAALLETLKLLHEPGHSVKWEGLSSMQPSSSFWKKLRHRLPAPSASRKSKTIHNKMENPCKNV